MIRLDFRPHLIGLFLYFFLPTPLLAFDHSHSLFDRVLKEQVVWSGSSSRVNYKELQKNPLQLDSYLGSLTAVKEAEFNVWSQNEQLAFLINAYNAFTLKLIINHYPVKSIKNIGGLFKSPWKIKFFNLLGQKTSLDWLEHEKIRRHYKEPRIHFALVCASIGCPALRNEPFVAQNLNQQLQNAALVFLNDSSRNRYDAKENRFYLSSIFKWYKEDFGSSKASLQEFVFPFMEALKKTDQNTILKADVDFLDYDWELNQL